MIIRWINHIFFMTRLLCRTFVVSVSVNTEIDFEELGYSIERKFKNWLDALKELFIEFIE